MDHLTPIIDADSMVYAAGFIADKTAAPASHACHALDMILHSVMKELTAVDHEVYLTGSSGSAARVSIYPEYKANRATARKPVHYEALREFLVTNWDALVVNNMEADDLVSVRGLDHKDNVIVSIDKDLWNTPGLHYHWKRKDLHEVSEHKALYNFYTQTLVGDVADNVKGVKGIGPKKAAVILDRAKDERELYDFCLEAYYENKMSKEQLDIACTVLWMARELDSFGNPIGWREP